MQSADNVLKLLHPVQARGLTPRVFEHLFQRIAELDEEAVSLVLSYTCLRILSPHSTCARGFLPGTP